MHIVIAGGGEIGYALARALAPKHDVFVIDHDPEVAERFARLDVEFVVGSATSGATLQRARVAGADHCIACTGLDEVNIVACSIAREAGARRTTCFVSKDDFLGAGGDGGDGLREHFGIDRVIWPEAQLAEDIERLVAAPGAIDAETFADGRIEMREYRLSDASPFVGPIAGLGLPAGAVIVAVLQGSRLTIPTGATVLAHGDKVVVMGTIDAIADVQARVLAARGLPARQAVTIIGGGDVGFRLAQRLDRRPDIDLRIIECTAQRGELMAARLRRALVLRGDGTDLELLQSEEIGRSDVLVSVIDNDERNLLASLLGRQLGVRRIVTRVGKPANLKLFERVGIDVAISARGAAVAAVVHQLEGGASKMLAVLEEGEAQVLELEVPPGFPETALKDLAAPSHSIVGAILRGGQAIVPRGGDVIRPGDRLIVFTASNAAEDVRGYFTAPAA
jgi:trk system potassium uptake protein TrkA